MIINTKMDSQMKWLGLIDLGLFIIIVTMLITYYNLVQDVFVSVGIGFAVAGIILSIIIKKVILKNE